jgi:hypothetical protein
MEVSVLRSLHLLVALLLAAAFRTASQQPAKILPRGGRVRAWPPTYEARSLKRVEVPKAKARILAVDYDRGSLQTGFLIQRAAA